MKASKLPTVLKNHIDQSISVAYNQPQYSLIWLHGLNDHSQTYLPFFTHLQSPIYHRCRVKLLQAPRIFISVNQEETYGWFDLKSTNRFANPEDQVYDLEQINHTKSIIQQAA